MKSSSNIVDSKALESWKFMPKVRVRQGGETLAIPYHLITKLAFEQFL